MDIFDIGVAPDLYTVASAEEIRAGAHVELAAPCVHPWMLLIVRALLGHPLRDLEAVVDGTSWLVIEPAGSAHRFGDPISAIAVADASDAVPGFVAHTHAGALAAMLERIDLGRRRAAMAARCAELSDDRRRPIESILERVDAAIACGLRPRDLVLDAVPLPPLGPTPPASRATRRRPEFLYAALIATNQRLAELLRTGAPTAMLHAARVRLQEAVDDALTAGIGKLMHDAAPASAWPELAYTKLDASVTVRDDERAEPRNVQAETRALRWAGARAIVAAASPRDEAVMRALCAKLRSCAAATP